MVAYSNTNSEESGTTARRTRHPRTRISILFTHGQVFSGNRQQHNAQNLISGKGRSRKLSLPATMLARRWWSVQHKPVQFKQTFKSGRNHYLTRRPLCIQLQKSDCTKSLGISTFTPSLDQAGTLALTYQYNPVACPISFHPLCLRSCQETIKGIITQGQLLRHVVPSLRNPNMQCNAQSDLLVLELKRQRAGHGDILQKGCVMSHTFIFRT